MPSAAFTAAVATALTQFHTNAQANRDQAVTALDLQRAAETAALEQVYADLTAARDAAVQLVKNQLGIEVDRAFLTILNRLPSAEEHASWTDIVYSTGAQSVRAWAAQQAGLDVYQLDMAANSQANAQSVKQVFQIYLFRDPTADEQSFWLNYTNGTGSIDALLHQLSVDSNATMRYGFGLGSSTDNVTQAFNVMFGRAPSVPEKLIWASSSGYALPWILAQAASNHGSANLDSAVLANRILVAEEIRALAADSGASSSSGSSSSQEPGTSVGAATLEALVTNAIMSTGATTQSMSVALKTASDIINPPAVVTTEADTTPPAEGAISRSDGVLSMTFSEPIKWAALDTNGSGRVDFSELPIQLLGQGVTFGSQVQVLSAVADRLVLGVGADARLGGGSILLKNLPDLAGNKADMLFTAPADVGTSAPTDTTAPSDASIVRESGVVVLNFSETIQWSAMDSNHNGKVEFSELPIVITGAGSSFGTSPLVLSAQGPRLVISVGADAVVDGPIFLSGVKDLAGNSADVLFV